MGRIRNISILLIFIRATGNRQEGQAFSGQKASGKLTIREMRRKEGTG